MSKSQRIHNRIKRIENRFKNKVTSGRKGTDMDIEMHERRIRKLSNKAYNTEGATEGMQGQAMGFIMPHSPLNQNDSIAASKAWNKFKSGYMDRKQHMGKPITAEQNLAEYNREKNEFYYDTQRKKLRLIPTDDGEVQDESFKSKLKKWQFSPLNQNEEVYNMTPNATEAESKAVRDKFDATYMKGRGKVNETEPHADSEWENATYQLMNEGAISESNDQAYPAILARVERNRGNR